MLKKITFFPGLKVQHLNLSYSKLQLYKLAISNELIFGQKIILSEIDLKTLFHYHNSYIFLSFLTDDKATTRVLLFFSQYFDTCDKIFLIFLFS